MSGYMKINLMGLHILVALCLTAGYGKAAPGACFRVVNTTTNPAAYRFTVRHHRAPWTIRNQSFPDAKTLKAGATSRWVRLGTLVNRAPVTVQIHSTPPGHTGMVEFAASDNPAQILRSLPLDKRTLTVEFETLAPTNARQIRTDMEIGAATLATVRQMTFKGAAPQRFPTGWPAGTDDEYRAGRLLGFTAVHGQAMHLPARFFDEFGYRYIYSYSHWLGMWDQGGGGYRRDQNDRTAATSAAQWKQSGLDTRLWRISIRDEAALDAGKSLFKGGMEKDTNYWPQVIAAAGLTPDDFIDPDDPPPAGLGPESPEYWKKLRGFSKEDRLQYPRQVYNTLKVVQSIWPLRFGNFRDSLRKHFGDRLLVTANIHMTAYFKDNLSGIDPWLVYSRLQALDVPQVCDYLVSWPQQEEFLIDLQRCALRPHTNNPVDAMLQAQQAYMPRPPEHLKLCAVSALGAGARSLTFYQWGPRYLATENWYDTDPARLRVIGEINHAAGWVEDILLDGAPPRAKIAILYSRPSELWDRLAPATDIDNPGRYLAERRVLYHLLRGLHQPVDFIHDEVLPAEQGLNLDDYKVIFMSQRCITEKGATTLLDWVRRGGTLVGIVSIGQFNEIEQPWNTMLDAFGLASLTVAFDSGTDPKRIPDADITLRNEKAMYATVTASTARVVASFDDGTPAITENPMGAGRLIYAAWGPGNAYHRFSGESDAFAKRLRLLTGMQAKVRDVVAPWLSGTGAPRCETDHPLVSARLIESARGSAVFLINSTGQAMLPSVQVTLRGINGKTIESLEQGTLQPEPRDDGIQVVSLPMGLTDVLRIR